MRFNLVLIFLLSSTISFCQNVESFGVFAGLNVPFTLDQGLHKDPRYFGRVTLRSTPFGFNYGYDKVGYGIIISPSYLKIGQQFAIHNTSGGEVGKRDIKMNFFSVPVSLKLHLNDMAFFRLSMVAAVNFNYLVSAEETQTWEASKLQYPKVPLYPANVIIPTDPGYSEVYDGVFVPQIKDQVYVTKDKFNALQIFAGLGLRSDFDINDNWSLNFDGRANFGLFDPRKADYTNMLKTNTDVPDLYGQRRDMYLSVAVGFSYIIITKEKFKARSSAPPPHVRPKEYKSKKGKKGKKHK